MIANAKAKLTRKGCDWIVANDVSPETGIMGGETNSVHLVTADGVETWPSQSKDDVARALVATNRRRAGRRSGVKKIDVEVKRLAHAADLPLPKYQSELAAGLDLLAAIPPDAPMVLAPGERAMVPTGLCMALPAGTEGQVRPRSGLAARYGITVLNAPGTVDADFRGEIQVILINHGSDVFTVERGMRIAQLVIATAMQANICEVCNS